MEISKYEIATKYKGNYVQGKINPNMLNDMRIKKIFHQHI